MTNYRLKEIFFEGNYSLKGNIHQRELFLKGKGSIKFLRVHLGSLKDFE